MTRTKYALVTGCGKGGIGEALILEYVRQGFHAIATVLPQESSTHFSNNSNVSVFTLDVTVDKSVIELKNKVEQLTSGHLDILVNCAGIAYTMTAIDTDVEAAKRMFEVNVFGPMRMVRHFHAMLIESEGAIVNIGSIGGVIPYLYGASYNATKAALAHWGNTLRIEMSPFNVRVITIISGEVSTNILKNDAHRTLPDGSYYAPLADSFKQHVTRTPAGATDRHLYAKNVVAESLKKSPKAWFWYGSYTGMIWFYNTFGSQTAFDSMLYKMFGLGKLRDAYLAASKKK